MIPKGSPKPAPDPAAVDDRLDSWKAIASHLKKSVRTVTRWEREQGLPVHRHSTGTVYAYKPELDAWWNSRGTELQSEEQNEPPSPGSSFRRRAIRSSAGAVGLMLTITIIWYAVRPSARPAARLVPLTTYPGVEGPPSLSPDGSQVAFARGGDIFVKQVDGEALVQLTSTSAVESSPSWSPDGRQLAFRRDGSILVMSPLGGGEKKIIETRTPPLLGRIAWTPDSQSIVISELTSSICASLFLVSIATLQRTRLTSPPEPSIGDGWPGVSPDGRTLAFARYAQDTSATVYTAPMNGGAPRQITAAQGLMFGLAWSPGGTDLVFSSNRDGSIRLWHVSAKSTPRTEPALVAGAAENARFPAVSHAGSRGTHRLAYQQFEPNMDIRRSEIVSNGTRQRSLQLSFPFIASTRSEDHPHYSRDGRKIAFVSNRSGAWEVWVSDHDASRAVRLTSMGAPIVLAPRWSPDGRRIVFFATTGSSGKYQSWIVDAEGGPARRLTGDDTQLEALPNWSSDGGWIYFASGRSGSLQIWKVQASGGAPVQITKGGGSEAAESPDGKSIYYAKVQGGGPGLWTVPTGGGQETKVLDSVRFGYWAVVDTGIYFIDFDVADDAPRPMKFFSFDDRKVTQIGTVERSVSWRNNPGFAVSPDGRWLLYSNLQSVAADLMLLDTFR